MCIWDCGFYFIFVFIYYLFWPMYCVDLNFNICVIWVSVVCVFLRTSWMFYVEFGHCISVCRRIGNA